MREAGWKKAVSYLGELCQLLQGAMKDGGVQGLKFGSVFVKITGQLLARKWGLIGFKKLIESLVLVLLFTLILYFELEDRLLS